jgi:outer membrane protein OmpA-like peptidoglycan-associated protein
MIKLMRAMAVVSTLVGVTSVANADDPDIGASANVGGASANVGADVGTKPGPHAGVSAGADLDTDLDAKTDTNVDAMKMDKQGKQGKQGERALSQVFFDFDSDKVDHDLLMVANELECTPNDTIILDAYTDPVGPDAYNVDLALRRAEAVKGKLVGFGIDEDRIMLGIFGEQGAQRDTHEEDRRVEIRTSNESTAALQDRRSSAVATVAPGESTEQVGKR